MLPRLSLWLRETPILTWRKKLGLVLILCGVVLVLSYGFAGYLLYKRSRPPASTPRDLSQSGRRKTEELLAAADRYLKNRQVEQALVAYREVLALDPRSPKALMGVAEGELRAGREEVAAREYERVVKLDGSNKTALLQLARIYSHQSKTWPPAEVKYREYLALDPGDAQAHLGLARVLAWQGKAEEAARLFFRAEVARLMTIGDSKGSCLRPGQIGPVGRRRTLVGKAAGCPRG